MTYAPVVVCDYDSDWVIMFEEAKGDILKTIGSYVAAIEHVGSTAVPGLAAKPFIDILLAPHRFPQDVEGLVDPLAQIGFEYVPKSDTNKYFFRRGEWGHGTHHLHVVQIGDEEWTKVIRFRDYLRSHPEAAQRYGNLKRRLATKFGSDRPGYTSAKADFIRSVLATAEDERG